MAKDDKSKPKENAPTLVPPDGGWGWVILIGYSLSNIVVIPMIQNTGLIFMDRFREIGFNPKDVTSLITLNSYFGMLLGIFNGPLLKKFGYRKMAFAGITAFTMGIFLSGLANNYTHFAISYGMLTSVGMTTTMGAFSLAMNSYFRKNRSKASSFTSTLTGLGPIIMPYVITVLLAAYGVKWTVFILSAINSNAYVGACLLQPVKWHMKKLTPAALEEVKEDEEENKLIQVPDSNSFFGYDTSISGSRRSSLFPVRGRSVSAVYTWNWQDSLHRRKSSAASQEVNKRNLMNTDLNVEKKEHQKSVTDIDNENYDDMMSSVLHLLEKPHVKGKPAPFASSETLDSVDGYDWRSNILLKPPPMRRLVSLSEPGHDRLSEEEESDDAYCGDDEGAEEDNGEDNDEKSEEEKKPGCFRRMFNYIKNLYDLDLFLDPIYINIMLGISIALMGELLFSLLTPFILDEFGLTLKEIATFVSVTAVTDLITRSVSSHIGSLLKFSNRAMYILALFLLMVTRASIFLASSYESYLAVAAALGIGKGVRTVYWILVLPDYVPLSKLPSASAFQGLANGLLILLSGPLLRAIVGIDNRYSYIIFASNAFTLTTILMWSIEFLIVKCKRKKKDKESKRKKQTAEEEPKYGIVIELDTKSQPPEPIKPPFAPNISFDFLEDKNNAEPDEKSRSHPDVKNVDYLSLECERKLDFYIPEVNPQSNINVTLKLSLLDFASPRMTLNDYFDFD